MIKVNAPHIGREEVEIVEEVLRSGMLAQGKYVELFEKQFAHYVGVPYAVTVSNGSIAIYSALKALGVGPGDEVIVPDFTFFSTASTVVLAGAKPVFVDIDKDTYTINPNEVADAVTERTKAVIAVHLYGHPSGMDELMKIGKEYGLSIIEDCAQAHGAEYKGEKVGSLGTAGTFSFYATKNMTMGEGGAVTTKKKEVYEYIRLLRNHGQSRRYYHEIVGWNFRITNMQGALGLIQLNKLPQMNRRRREIAKIYMDELSGIEELTLPIEKPWAKHVFHQFTVWVSGDGKRDKLREYLMKKGIQTGVHYPIPLHLQPALSGYADKKCCPVAYKASQHVLSLPMHVMLTDDEVLQVCTEIKSFFNVFKA
ncbi:MAG: aminotransferase DegT [Thermoprotei archaeon]|nr:MAG: aminotransferase DegT [Thermoprotei archaeon]